MGIAEFLRGPCQKRLQYVFSVFIQQSVRNFASVILQGAWVTDFRVGFDPIVNRLPSHPQHSSDVSDGSAIVELQDREGTAIKADILGFRELPAETVSLPSRQMELAHGSLLQS